MLAGGALVATALLRRPRTADAPLWGAGPLLALGVLAAYTALSVLWSLAPADSWVEANRTFAYLAVFASGIALVRLMPGRWPGVVMGIGAGCLLISAWALLTKVFPASLAADETYARLREPFAYWNSVGLMAALGVPPMLWLAARRSGHAAANAIAWPAIARAAREPDALLLARRAGRARDRRRPLVPRRAAAPAGARRAGGGRARRGAARRLGVRAGRPDHRPRADRRAGGRRPRVRRAARADGGRAADRRAGRALRGRAAAADPAGAQGSRGARRSACWRCCRSWR